MIKKLIFCEDDVKLWGKQHFTGKKMSHNLKMSKFQENKVVKL